MRTVFFMHLLFMCIQYEFGRPTSAVGLLPLERIVPEITSVQNFTGSDREARNSLPVGGVA